MKKDADLRQGASVIRSLARVRVPALLAAVLGSALAQSSITGTATYRERIALPPDAVFEATLEDVSKADARAEVLGRATIERPGAPPFRFTGVRKGVRNHYGLQSKRFLTPF